MGFLAYWLLVDCGKVCSDIHHRQGRVEVKGEAAGATDHRNAVRSQGRYRTVLSPRLFGPLLLDIVFSLLVSTKYYMGAEP